MNTQRVLMVAAMILVLSLAGAAQLIRGGAGANPADIQAIVDTFRNDLGALNPNTPGSFTTGRREINWDGIPDAFAAPNFMPGDFFNQNVAGRALGYDTPRNDNPLLKVGAANLPSGETAFVLTRPAA